MLNISRITITRWSVATLLASQAYLAVGCEEPYPTVDDVVHEGDDEFRAWTGFTSEEFAPLTCPSQQAVGGVLCNGGWCDNIALYCGNTGRYVGESTWSQYFSEEGYNMALCPYDDMWMTGLDCDGGWCDNLSMQCSVFHGSSVGECSWSDWYSEEQGPFYAPFGSFIKGIQCRGGWCDDMRYLYCRML